MSTTSPYLQNEYTPLTLSDELDDWIELSVIKGIIPEEIEGYFLRNSSNPQFKPNNNYHWFDGDGYIQGCKFVKGKVFFKGKFIRTEKFVEENAAGKSLYGGLKGPISKNNILQGIRGLFNFVVRGKNPFPNTSNTDLVYHHNTLFSMWMLCGPAYKIDLETLNTVGKYSFETKANNYKGVKHGISAHPKICPKDDTLFVMDFVNSWKRFGQPTAYISSISSDAQHIKTKQINISGQHFLHDIIVTENYVLFIDMPAAMTPLGLRHNKSKPARFGIIPCDFGTILNPKTQQQEDVLWFDDPSGCYIVHVVNGYEEDDKVVLFALRKPYLEVKGKTSNEITDVFDGYLHRWEFDLKTGEITQQTGTSLVEHFPHGSEFPTINDQFEGLKNRYSYLPSISRTPQFNFNAFSKYDHLNDSYSKYDFPKDVYMGELRFIPKQAAQTEDDGWLVTFVHDTRPTQQASFLYLFDAQNIEQGPITIVSIPFQLPIGFHTTWIDQKDV